MKFKEVLAQLLKEKGLSSRDLARSVHISPSALTKYSQGATPGLDVALRIADALDVSLDYLTTGVEPRKKCPDVDHHAIIEEFGLGELALLASLGTQAPIWQITKVLLEYIPRAVTFDELRAALPALSEQTLHAALLAMRIKSVVVESNGGYRLGDNVPEYEARQLGDIGQHVKVALDALFGHVIPAIERQDSTGHLLTMTAEVPDDVGRDLIHRLRVETRRYSKAAMANHGNTTVSVVLGLAVDKKSD